MEFTIRVVLEQAEVLAMLHQANHLLKRIERKLMSLETQLTQLQSAVADVKQASDEEAVRVDKIIEALQSAGDNPIVAQAITDLGQTASMLRAFHADTPIEPPQPPVAV